MTLVEWIFSYFREQRDKEKVSKNIQFFENTFTAMGPNDTFVMVPSITNKIQSSIQDELMAIVSQYPEHLAKLKAQKETESKQQPTTTSVAAIVPNPEQSPETPAQESTTTEIPIAPPLGILSIWPSANTLPDAQPSDDVAARKLAILTAKAPLANRAALKNVLSEMLSTKFKAKETKDVIEEPLAAQSPTI